MSAGLGPTLACLGASLPSHQQEAPSTENSRGRKLATSLKEEEIRTHQSKQCETKFGRRGEEPGLRPSHAFGDGQPCPMAAAAGPPLEPHELPTAKVREQRPHPQSPLLPPDRQAHPTALPSQEWREARAQGGNGCFGPGPRPRPRWDPRAAWKRPGSGQVMTHTERKRCWLAFPRCCLCREGKRQRGERLRYLLPADGHRQREVEVGL